MKNTLDAIQAVLNGYAFLCDELGFRLSLVNIECGVECSEIVFKSEWAVIRMIRDRCQVQIELVPLPCGKPWFHFHSLLRLLKPGESFAFDTTDDFIANSLRWNATEIRSMFHPQQLGKTKLAVRALERTPS